jgi:hypothetical protein
LSPLHDPLLGVVDMSVAGGLCLVGNWTRPDEQVDVVDIRKA